MIRTRGFEAPEDIFGGESKTNDVLPMVETHLVSRCIHEPATKLERVDLPTAIACVKEYMATLSNECNICINLRADGTAISYCVLAIGTLVAVDAPTTEKNLLQSVVASNAAAVVLMHNHPECTNMPSSTDVLWACLSAHLCNMLDVQLYDVLVVGKEGIASVKEMCPKCFEPTFFKGVWTEYANQEFGAALEKIEDMRLMEQPFPIFPVKTPKEQEQEESECTTEVIGYDGPKMLKWSEPLAKTILPLVETRLVSKTLYATEEDTWEATEWLARKCAAEYLCTLASERVVCINLRADHQAISYCVAGIGSTNSCDSATTLVNALKSAIASNAAEITLVHNQPEGDGKPMQDDLDFAFIAAQLFGMIGRKLRDMIIVSRSGEQYSIRDNNPEYLTLVDVPYEFVKEIAERGKEKEKQEKQGKTN